MQRRSLLPKPRTDNKIRRRNPPNLPSSRTSITTDYISSLGFQNIAAHEKLLVDTLYRELMKIDGLVVYGPGFLKPRGSLISFSIRGIHPSDLTQYLSTFWNISLRDGMHCCQPLLIALGISSCLRISFGVYNTIAEVEEVVLRIKEGVKFLRGED